jgi:hypothetical protein
MNAERSTPPEWWRSLQSDLSALLAVPLVSDGGAFRPRTDAYAPSVVGAIVDDGPGAIARLALYHEQIWRRFFNALQGSFPRVARVMGAFHFNRAASLFLEQCPPQGVDLADIGVGFFPWLETQLDAIAPRAVAARPARLVETPLRELVPERPPKDLPLGSVMGALEAPWSLLSQALRFDEAERRAFRAPREPRWQPTPNQRARLSKMRVVYASSFSLVRLDYILPSSGARDELDARAPRSKTPVHWVVVRTDSGVATFVVDPLFARLLARAADEPLGDAVEAVSQAASGPLREHFVANLERYLERAIDTGCWIGAAR